MKQQFERIFNEYPSASLTSGQHPLRQFVSTTTANHFRELIDTRQYTVKASTGAGNWAAIPWVCIFDRDITDSATHGIYICYLFRADMSGVYLSLNQGWTYYKEKHPRKIHDARTEIRNVALAWREVLTSNLNDFNTTEIDLHHKGNLAEGYELGHICGKFYDTLQLPNDSVLIADLNSMIGVYRELKGHMEDVRDLSVTNEDILVSRAISEDVDDTKFQQRVSTAQPRYTTSPQARKDHLITRGRKTWRRDTGIAHGALENSNYLCEFDPSHVTYTSKRTGKNYVEAHHLVPLNLQEQFEYSLDVTANVVALCRNCHGRIHYAVSSEKEEMLEKLYEFRREQLLSHGIEIGLEDLKRAYD